MRNRKLAYPLRLRDGRIQRTLADVVDVFDTYFANVLRDEALAYAIRLLDAAARTGKRDAIAAATDQVSVVLRQRQLLGRARR